ncbi:MAG: immunoglobulin domain-containing protein [Planctomycetes bacterium]|nr:immunoglobulin domain-containing protein [Planctomycetota bacterium]
MKPGLFRTGRGIVAAALGVFLGGCVAIQDILVQATSGGRDDVPTTNGGDDGSNGEPVGGVPDEGVPVVSLSVSNPTPQVNEDVILTCTADGGNNGLTFDFQPAIGRLFVNDRTGIATFTVEESDVGQAFSFTCTGTNDQGTSEPSNEQMILATPL